MDKSKNRTDLLAAGRKKLQQFRKKKDQKGGSSSHGKSSGKTSKPENDDDPEEPSKSPEPQLAIDDEDSNTDQSDPPMTNEPEDSSSVPMLSADERRDQEEHPTISLESGAMQEANNSGSQECNGDVLENRKDDADGSVSDMAPDPGKIIEDLAAVSSSGLEVVQEIQGSYFQSEESGEGAGCPSISNTVESERDRMRIPMEEHMIKGGMDEEALAPSQAATQSSFLAEQLEEAGANLCDEPGERTSREENLGVQSSAQDMSSTNGEDDAVTVDAEGKRRNSEETAVLISGHGNTQEGEAGPPILAEELKVVGTNISDEATGATSLEETFAGPSSSHHFLAAEEEDYTVQADEEGERRNDEKAVLNSWRTQELDGPSIPEKELVENTNRSYRPEESTNVDETSGTISSTPQVFPVNKGGDGPNGTYYIEENSETIASPSADILATEGEDVADIADIEEERGVMEERVLQSSHEEDATVESLEKLPEQGVISVGVMSEGINKEDSQVGRSNSEVESIRQLLYISTIEKDVLQLQLDEQIALNAENQQQSFDEVSKLRDLVKETRDSNTILNEELKQCSSGLQAMAIAKEELETQCLSAKGEMEELRIRANELRNKLDQSQEGLSHVLVELADCRVSLETLQKENLDLTQSLTSGKDARKKLLEEKELFSSENKKLATEILEQEEQLIIALNNQVELQNNLRDAGACIEQLAEENLYLASSLDVHEAKLRELNERNQELPFEANKSWNQGMALLQKNAEEHCYNSILFGVLKQHLEVAENILHNLEKSVDSMHSHTLSLSRPGGRGAAPGISKIIQAFESKAHHVEIVSDEIPPLIEGGHFEDSYTLTKEQTCSLRDILKQIELDMGRVERHLTKEQNSRENPEMFVESEAENRNSFLQETIDGLVEKVSDYKSKIVDLQNHIDKIQQSANEETTRLSSQVVKLQEEVNHRVEIFKQEEHSNKSVIINAIGKLNACTGLHVDDGLDVGSHVMASIDTAVLAIKSLHEKLEAAHLNYNTLQASFVEMSRSFADLQGRNVLAFELLRKMYNSLREFVYDSYQSVGDALPDVNTDESLQVLPGKCDLLIEHLHELIDERHRLFATNNELEVGLLNRNHEIEELNMRCDALSKKLDEECHNKEGLESILVNRGKIFEEVSNRVLSLVQMLADHELSKDFDADSMFMKSDNMESDFCKSMLSRLEALVTFHLQKHEEVTEQINSSKIYLREVNNVAEISAENWSLPLHILLRQEIVPKMSELKEKLQLLSALNIQQETEIQILKEALGKLEETLEASRSELNSKMFELQQSEQRLSSVREKLSIAVAKGKGLIMQRDSLKQSLMEKSSELEKYMQELQSKDTLLQEVEAKLKSCSEVDRVEALESELSYIRNSATALRDSFLLKDSVLQRIEEVLEALDLPEHFHSKDIVEKIELLSRLVADNSSFPVADWDQKSSEGRSHSDAGVGGMDAWKDDIQPSSNQEFDELKRKYEELQSKFYGLAEHNDMLEQSLLERNSLVQKWEEMLDRMDMPSHLRTLEPEDRIKSLGRALSEIQQERDALQHKIENLEVSSDMLIGDLEDSHKKISELSAEVVTVKSEKDFFSESLDKLRFQYLALSEKAVHDEVERENLQRELADLQQKLVEQVEMKGYHDFENEIRKLHDLIIDALPDSDSFEPVSDENESASLEALVRKLIHNYTLLSDKSKNASADKEVHSEESNSSLDKQSIGDVLHDKNQQLLGLRLELDEASRNLSLVKEERDAAVEKNHSLTLEIDEIHRHMNLLQAERTHAMEKYQLLVLELEAVGKQRDAFQEQLSQEEQKIAAAKEKLNVAVRKGKGLVQQRDALKQTIEEMNTMVEHLKAEHNQRVEALESEKFLLMNQLAESKHDLQEYSQNLSRLMTIVHSIDVGTEVNVIDPIQKMEEIGKITRDLHSAVVSSEREAKKSKQAAELLLVELNEVQDRVDILQEDLEKAEAALAESYKQKNDAEAAKADALSHLEQFMSVHSEERKKQIDNLTELRSGIDQFRKGCIGFSSLLSDVFRKDADLFSYVQSFLESILQQMDGENVADLPVLGSNNLLHIDQISVDNFHVGDVLQVKNNSHFGDSLIAEHFAHACRSLHECTKEYDDMKEKVRQYPFFLHQQITFLLETLGSVKRKLDSQREYSESLIEEVTRLELVIKEKETEICSMHRNMSILYEACRSSIAEIENRKAQTVGSCFTPDGLVSGISSGVVTLPSYVDVKECADANVIHADHSFRTMADSLLSAIRSSTNTSETTEGNQRELKATISDLQRKLQEKDIEMKRISEQLVSQIRDAEAVSRRSLTDLDSARAQIFSLEKALAEMVIDKQLLEERISMLQDCEASLQQLQDRLKSLTDSLAAKDREIEGLRCGLMEALDEEELKMEAMENRNKELEDILQQKILAVENLEASQEKALAKLSTTMSKFDELHNLSESLLAEIESLQSQLQERDSEISFLRQEVTRYTNNDLASQETNKKYLSEITEVLTRVEMMVSRFGESHRHANDQKGSQIQIYTDILDKRIVSVMNELEDLRVTAQSKDALLQIERIRVEELLKKIEDLGTMPDKEIQREPSQGERDSVQPSSSNSQGHVEIDQMVQRNKVSSVPIVTHIRSGRKVNNDQIAVAIDMEKDDNVLDDEDDDKSHGFKSLTMSRLVPRATRPISDRIDGIWVSAERLLMRQPSLRLGVIVYWILLHALLASII